jgi:YXWGXW repeat-containing protein
MKRALLLTPLLALLSLAGCAVREAYVAVPPPPPRVEVFGYAPGPGYVWCDGYWNWAGARYTWVQGYWARPPHPHARWVRGRWEHRHGRYEFERGRWR